MAQKAWKKYLTEDEYNGLTPEGMPEWAAQEFVNEELYSPQPEK